MVGLCRLVCTSYNGFSDRKFGSIGMGTACCVEYCPFVRICKYRCIAFLEMLASVGSFSTLSRLVVWHRSILESLHGVPLSCKMFFTVNLGRYFAQITSQMKSQL
jgi:hypothetical protein